MDLFTLPAALLFLLLAGPAYAQLPYDPTRILQSRQDNDIIYVFRPDPSATAKTQLLSLDVSSALNAADLPLTTLYPALPFATSTDDTAVPYIPVADEKGGLTVYAGRCGPALHDAKVWKFAVAEDAQDSNGTWTESDATAGSDGDGRTLLGPNFLSHGISFSSTVGDSDPALFAFGGMCPTDDATPGSWVAAANYSSAMLQVQKSSNDDDDSAAGFDVDVAPTRGPPVAEAGFGLVGLPPTFSNRSDGSADQQQNFVLLGGHTDGAFINMSQVALYSLPEETWTFIPVEQPDVRDGDLAKRAATVSEVEPRSGHTAVLSDDGTKIIVMGGWVGDVDTPAEPQLAVLNIGEGYGGEGAWSWSIPSPSGSGLADGAGIYGHGAVMLSGDVMMILGGYSISSLSSSSKLRGRATPAQNTQNFFFNVSSNSYLSDYSPVSDSSDSSDKGGLSSASQKAGLGVGIGIGVAAVVCMTIFYFWYKRHLREKREWREKELRELSLGAHYVHGIGPGNTGLSSRGRDPFADEYLSDREAAAYASDPWYSGGRGGWKGQGGGEAERTGLLVEIPSPTRGLRRNSQGRVYHQAPLYDDSRINPGAGPIHRIDERAEEEEEEANLEMRERPRTAETDYRLSIHSTGDSNPLIDHNDHEYLGSNHSAFPTQPTAHFPTSLGNVGKRFTVIPGPTSVAQARAAEVRPYTPNWEFGGSSLSSAAYSNSASSRSGLSAHHEKSDRTGSNLSDSSRSVLSARSTAASVARTLSIRSGALLASIPNPFRTPQTSPIKEHPQPSLAPPVEPVSAVQRKSVEYSRAPNSSHSNVNANADADSFTTAKTSFAQLQAEGEALLGGRPDNAENIPTSIPFPSLSPIDPDSPHYRKSFHQPPPPAAAEEAAQQSQQQQQQQQQQPQQRAITELQRQQVNRMGSADSLDLHSPVDNSFATRDRSKSWLGGVRNALGRRPTLLSQHDDGRPPSLVLGLHRRSRRYSYSNSQDSPQHSPDAFSTPHTSLFPWGIRSGESSPTKSLLDPQQQRPASSSAADGLSPPRRAASDAGFWAKREKRGSKAWTADILGLEGQEDEEDWIAGRPRPRTVAGEEAFGARGLLPGGAGAGDVEVVGMGGLELQDGEYYEDEGEWDVEAAAERRDVQLCFTVPRQRLRVVNADARAASPSVAGSEGEARRVSGRSSLRRVSGLSAGSGAGGIRVASLSSLAAVKEAARKISSGTAASRWSGGGGAGAGAGGGQRVVSTSAASAASAAGGESSPPQPQPPQAQPHLHPHLQLPQLQPPVAVATTAGAPLAHPKPKPSSKELYQVQTPPQLPPLSISEVDLLGTKGASASQPQPQPRPADPPTSTMSTTTMTPPPAAAAALPSPSLSRSRSPLPSPLPPSSPSPTPSASASATADLLGTPPSLARPPRSATAALLSSTPSPKSKSKSNPSPSPRSSLLLTTPSSTRPALTARSRTLTPPRLNTAAAAAAAATAMTATPTTATPTTATTRRAGAKADDEGNELKAALARFGRQRSADGVVSTVSSSPLSLASPSLASPLASPSPLLQVRTRGSRDSIGGSAVGARDKGTPSPAGSVKNMIMAFEQRGRG